MKPRVLFVSRRVELPLSPSLARKWDAIGEEIDFRVLAGGSGGNGTFRLARELPALDGPAFFAALPRAHRTRAARVPPACRARPGRTRDCRRARRAQARAHEHGGHRRSPRRLASADSAVRLEAARTAEPRCRPCRTHRAAQRGRDPHRHRLHHRPGARARPGACGRVPRVHGLRLVPADAAATARRQRRRRCSSACSSATRTSTVSPTAWRLAAPRVPEARLHLVGSGTLQPVVEQLVRDLPAQTSWTERLAPSGVSAALDESTLLVLPSRSEGMGRVLIEAFCRARPVVASRVGGIPDLVEDGVNGLLVEPGNVTALADALVSVLADRRPGGTARRGSRGELRHVDDHTGGVRRPASRIGRADRRTKLERCAQTGSSRC